MERVCVELGQVPSLVSSLLRHLGRARSLLREQKFYLSPPFLRVTPILIYGSQYSLFRLHISCHYISFIERLSSRLPMEDAAEAASYNQQAAD